MWSVRRPALRRRWSPPARVARANADVPAAGEGRLVRVMSLVAFAIVLTTIVTYVGLINAQRASDQPYISRFVAGYMALMAALLVIALVPRPEIVPIRVAIRAAVASGLFLLGFLFSFPVGLAFVAAGFLVFFALRRTAREATRSRPARLSGLVAAALAVAVLLVGLEVAQRVIVCPERRSE